MFLLYFSGDHILSPDSAVATARFFRISFIRSQPFILVGCSTRILCCALIVCLLLPIVIWPGAGVNVPHMGSIAQGGKPKKEKSKKRRVYSLWCIPGAEKGINCYIQRMQEVFVGLIPESLTQIRQNIIDVLCPYGKAYGVGLDSLL